MIHIRKGSPEYQQKAAMAWSAALRLQQFVYGNISFECGLPLSTTTDLVNGWETDGKIRRIYGDKVRGRASKITFEVIPQGEVVITPEIGDAVQQMWTTMRKVGSFTPFDLVATCSVPVTHEAAATYCRTLLNAGYLRVVQKAVPPSRPATYRLINQTGIKAPRLRRIACIVDPNLGSTKPVSEVYL